MYWFLSHILVQKQKRTLHQHMIPFLDSNDYFFVFYGISHVLCILFLTFLTLPLLARVTMWLFSSAGEVDSYTWLAKRFSLWFYTLCYPQPGPTTTVYEVDILNCGEVYQCILVWKFVSNILKVHEFPWLLPLLITKK